MDVKVDIVKGKLVVSLWDYETLVGGCIIDPADEITLEDLERIGNTIVKLVRWELDADEGD